MLEDMDDSGWILVCSLLLFPLTIVAALLILGALLDPRLEEKLSKG